MQKQHITIFSDGSSRGNPGPGGWAAIVAIPKTDKVMELGGHADNTTNNRMELTGALNALLKIRHMKEEAVVHTDSSYLINGITKWVKGWVKNGWTTQGREEVLNRDLWELLAAVLEERESVGGKTKWVYVAGHAGIPGNERVDIIATACADEEEVEFYDGSLKNYAIDIYSLEPKHGVKKTKDAKRSRGNAKAYSYVSKVSGKIMTHKTWAECEARVKGVSGAKFKKALSASEEKEIIEEWSKD